MREEEIKALRVERESVLNGMHKEYREAIEPYESDFVRADLNGAFCDELDVRAECPSAASLFCLCNILTPPRPPSPPTASLYYEYQVKNNSLNYEYERQSAEDILDGRREEEKVRLLTHIDTQLKELEVMQKRALGLRVAKGNDTGELRISMRQLVGFTG